MSSTADRLPLTFGGGWTRMKLDTIERYLDAYTTALRDKGPLTHGSSFLSAPLGAFSPGARGPKR